MPDLKISEMVAAAMATGAELIEVVQSGNNRKGTLSNLIPSLVPTASEVSAGLVLVNPGYPPGDFRRHTNVHDGSADITSVLTSMNTAHKVIVFPPGTVVNCINWVPLPDTTIIAWGATVRRHSDAVYSTTTSSDSVVVANNNVAIHGGKWTQGPAATEAEWSGAILMDGGENCKLFGVEIYGTWGGVHGNEDPHGVNLSGGLTLQNCWMHDNQHNNYLADIDGLIINACVSENSTRDGIRTYRNVRNVTITGNVLRNNGDGTVGQSQDAIDLFVAGYQVTIVGNIMHGNSVKGVDIKRNADFPSETFEDHRIIVADNFIFDNGDRGIEIEVADGVGTVDYVKIHGNIITENGERGIMLDHCLYPSVQNNTVLENGNDGIRMDDCTGALVTGNTIIDNAGVGINCLTSTHLITGNMVKSTGAQTQGISTSGGFCRDNDVDGHGLDFNLSGTLPVKGKTIHVRINNDTTTQTLAIAGKWALSGIEVAINNTEAGMDVFFQKRNASTGAFSASICANLAVAFPTAYVAVSQTVTGTASQRNVDGGECLTLSFANRTTNTFTDGVATIHYID